MKLQGLNNIVYPLRLTSSAAAHIFHCHKIQADVAYIDADHDYNAVIRDIQLYYPLVRKEGILMGHNFTLKGVEQAKDEWPASSPDLNPLDYSIWSLLEADVMRKNTTRSNR
uniref:Class I SAM-dependent methyltransferase n=1 Tax=Acrobeloides nanus TaxID=290746 RepID=A0A914E7B3_9BILA